MQNIQTGNMTNDTRDNFAGGETVDSAALDGAGYIDIHCHCLAGIDDGPDTQAESVALCRALAADGIRSVIATPHQLGRFSSYNEAPQVREEVFALNEELKSNNITLTVVPGADVRVDERICQLLEADKILTLADGGKYILLELPHNIFIDIEPLLAELSSMGVKAIISHPERHSVLANQPEVLLKWFKHSAHLQITAGSLVGEFGVMPQKAGWHFLTSGRAKLVATDSHDLNGRRPCMQAAFKDICVKLGQDVARLVCVENPLRVLQGRDIVSISGIRISEYKPKRVRNGKKQPSRFR